MASEEFNLNRSLNEYQQHNCVHRERLPTTSGLICKSCAIAWAISLRDASNEEATWFAPRGLPNRAGMKSNLMEEETHNIPARGYGMSFSEYGEATSDVLESLEIGVEYTARLEKSTADDEAPEESKPIDLVLRRKIP